jgi:SH3-like domain-containing protein
MTTSTSRFLPLLRRVCGAAALLGIAAGLGAPVMSAASAAEFRSVSEAGVLYDAPSAKGKRLFVIRRYTPVEVVVNLEGWSKVRDADGGLAWIERKNLVEKRTVQVTADRAEVRAEADAAAALVFSAEKKVALELISVGPAGWAKVRHRDGQEGFIRANQVWGL